MRVEDSPHYAQWRDAIIDVAHAQWAVDAGDAAPSAVEHATARYDSIAARLHAWRDHRFATPCDPRDACD
jgi:hypothetical protein